MNPPRCLALLFAALSFAAAQPSQAPLPDAERTRWFREAKFGIFIHWGAYSVIGRNEWAREMFQIPQAEYDTYARRFNPVKFDPDAWAELVKNAGAKYVVITSKHHEGFTMFRSKLGDYGIAMTPYKGDPLKMLADACKRKGVRLGFYHSIMDWHHPDYVPKRAWETPTPNEGGDLDRYIESYMIPQIKELLTNYGDVAIMWFDGQWEHSSKELHSEEVYDLIRKMQPNTIVNDRLFYKTRPTREVYGTPEQFVPATGLKDDSGKPILWESCVTINNDSWGYNKYETEFKTDRDLIRMLIEVASKGGNLLLNVGPGPDGTIRDEFVSRLNAMGRWMKVNGEAIYGTAASPFSGLPFFGRATVKGNTIYLHVFEWPKNGILRVPGVENRVNGARLLAHPAAKVDTKRDGPDVLVSVPKEAPDDAASVVALTLDGPPSIKPFTIRPDAKGALTLGAESCEIETDLGQRAKKENFLGHVAVTNWTRDKDVPTWTVAVPNAGRYKITVTYAHGGEGGAFTVVAGGKALPGQAEKTGGDWVFKTFPAGEIELPAGGQTLQVKSGNKINLERITLVPAF